MKKKSTIKTSKRFSVEPPNEKTKRLAGQDASPLLSLPTFSRSKAAKAVVNVLPPLSLPSGSDKEAGERGRSLLDTLKSGAVSPALIGIIRERCARRNAAMSACTRISNQTGALARRFLGWQTNKAKKDQTEISKEEQTKIKEVAAAIVTAVKKETASELPKDQQEVAIMIAEFVVHSEYAKKPFKDIKEKEEEELEKLAEQLPAAAFIKSIKGVGLLKLAQIIGETGDLHGYSNPGKLWKRLGLAPYKGRSPSTWRMTKDNGLKAEDWVAMGYSPMRRALMFVIGDCLIKTKADHVYKELYYSRKEYEIAREPDIKPIIAHRRAHRIMVKRLVKHIWQAWRGFKPNDNWVKS
jgi:hypothetical protein